MNPMPRGGPRGPRRIPLLLLRRRRRLAVLARTAAGALAASWTEALVSLSLVSFAVLLATGAGRSLGADLLFPAPAPAGAAACEVAAADVFLDWFGQMWPEAQ